MIPFAIGWGVLALIVAALAAYRSVVAQKEDDYVHLVSGPSNVLSQQTQVAQKLDSVEKWGKILTAVLIVYGLVLLAMFLFNSFTAGQQLNVQ